MKERFARWPRVGFTLVEVLITVAIMAVVMLGLMQLVTFNFKAQQGVQDSSDLNTFGNALQLIMGVNTGCTANLTGGGLPGFIPVQFNVPTTTYPSTLQTTLPTSSSPILAEIDYPMPGTVTGTYVPNTNSPLVKLGGTYGSWNVSKIGIQVLGTVSPTQYYILIEVDFKKKTDTNGALVSIGSSVGLRQTTALTVTTTTPDASNNVTVQGCGSGGVQVGWVTIDSGTVNDPSGQYQGLCWDDSADHSPTHTCQVAGYSGATGQARYLVTSSDYFYTISVYSPSGDLPAYSGPCMSAMWGSPGQLSNTPTGLQVQCIK